ncbi:MAG: Smr/MutS family protein [Hyphomicrobiales bacterium]|nr:Smr/MutS family protein [Hyphomicrobiales bacterium]
MNQRRLTPEEWELWRLVTASVKPRRPRPAAAPEPPPAKPTPQVAHSYAEVRPQRPAVKPLVDLDRRALRDLERGRAPIEARLDLHGLTVAQAHQRVMDFIAGAHRAGMRLVLIVTGKGAGKGAGKNDDPFFGDFGVLRRQVPLWLADPRLRASIAGFGAAAQRHGGAGALYVRIRRK